MSVFFFYCFGVHRDLHSFPTRRSSDLDPDHRSGTSTCRSVPWPGAERTRIVPPAAVTRRSEEHTSELQSLAYLVCRLLLEKKNNICKAFNPLKFTWSCTSRLTATYDTS